jgi:hypothetical protein
MQRACFLLLAAVMIIMMGETLLAVVGCGYMVLAGRAEPGVCIQAGIVGQAREVLSEALTAVLALLLAARNGRRPPDG